MPDSANSRRDIREEAWSRAACICCCASINWPCRSSFSACCLVLLWMASASSCSAASFCCLQAVKSAAAMSTCAASAAFFSRNSDSPVCCSAQTCCCALAASRADCRLCAREGTEGRRETRKDKCQPAGGQAGALCWAISQRKRAYAPPFLRSWLPTPASN